MIDRAEAGPTAGTHNTDEQDGPRWRRRSEARPGEIVEAALDLFVEKGFAATKMDEIAKRAGVTKGTVYLYFPSKEDLFRAVVEEMMGPNIEAGERLVAEHEGTATDLLRKLILAWWELVGNSPSTTWTTWWSARGASSRRRCSAGSTAASSAPFP
jgi:AcrR family transcriptional regulator